MSRTTRRRFTRTLTIVAAAIPIVATDVLTQTTPGSRPAEKKSPEAQPAAAKVSPLGEALAAVAVAQSGRFLDGEEIARVKQDFQEYVPFLERFREFKLVNADEPDFTFASLTRRW